jgi:hypothetical protein
MVLFVIPVKNLVISQVGRGLPLAAGVHVVGPTGGYGWIISWNQTAHRRIKFTVPEIDPSSPLLISIPYPVGATFKLTALGKLVLDRI